jgi:hypothetical protein
MKALGILTALAVLGGLTATAAQAAQSCPVLTLQCKWHRGDYVVLRVDGSPGAADDFPSIARRSNCVEAIDTILAIASHKLAAQPTSTALGLQTLVFRLCEPDA